VQLRVITVTSLLSIFCFVHCVGVVIAVILKQILLLKVLFLYAPTCHMFFLCHP
jgi:hypothetical protein